MEDDVAPILRHIKAVGFIGYLGSLPLILVLSLCMGLSLSVKSIISFFFFKPRNVNIDESELIPNDEFEHETIPASGGVMLHALTMGPRVKSKPLMLFLHGFPECSYSWRHQMRRFSSNYTVVAIDMRGFGRSDKPSGIDSYKLEILISDIVEVIRYLGGGSPLILVGHDWGGILSWLVAAMHPELISHLIVLAAPHLGLASINQSLDQMSKSWYILFFQAPWLPEWMLTRERCSFMDGIFFSPPMGLMNRDRVSPLDVEVFKREFLESGAATATCNYYRSLFRNSTYAPSRAIWAAMKRRIRVPTLLLYAENDGALGMGLIKDLDQVLTDLEVRVLVNCSHWIQQDQPEMTNTLIDDFLTRKS